MTATNEPSVFTIRAATIGDVAALAELVATSTRGLSRNDYSDEQIEAALGGAMGVDTQMIEDGTYSVVYTGRAIAACGGWSRRKTLFGADAARERDPQFLDPATDAARIRAFFVHPDFARRGIGRMLLQHCESAAEAEGFRRTELMATLPGQRLYLSAGYVPPPMSQPGPR
jgi:GNAT superfamily N-acetyltransferase